MDEQWISVQAISMHGEWVYMQDVYLTTRMVILCTDVGKVQIKRFNQDSHAYTCFETLQTCNSLDEAKEVYLVMAKLEAS